MTQVIGDPEKVDADKDENTQTSRLIVKNLPTRITVDRLKQLFGEHGLVTDCQLKFNSCGKFRNFAFIGFRTVDEAQKARGYFDNTYLDSSKIHVEFCKKLESNELSRKKNKAKIEKAPSKNDCMQLIFENLPRNVKKKTLKNFIAPVKALKIDVNTNDSESYTTAVVKVVKKSDVKVLEKLDGKFFGGQKINVKTCDISSTNDDNNPATIKFSKEITSVKEQTELISETGRLFVRNIPYVCALDDVQKAFEKFGPLADLKMPLDPSTKQHKGYAMVSFVLPENALRAFAEMDGTVFNGRMLHVVPGEESKDESKKQVELQKIADGSSFKAKKALKQKTTAVSSYNWNTLFLGQNAVADVLAEKLGTEKGDLLNAKSKTSLGVRMALGETQLVKETREFLQENGVDLSCFSDEKRRKLARSSTIILAKNLPAKTSIDELKELFGAHGDLGRVVLPPSGISALIEFMNEQEAKKAFKALAYKRFKKSTPLFLEWAPTEVFSGHAKSENSTTIVENVATTSELKTEENSNENMMDEQHNEEGATLFVKNLNFNTTDEQLRQHFAKIGSVKSASIAKKKAPSSSSSAFLSMGYGFVEFNRKSDAMQALKVLQRKSLDDFALELKLSEKHSTSAEEEFRSKKRQNDTTSGKSETKLLVRNVPFQATSKEIESLFKTFGELRSVRMPKKTGARSSSSSSKNQHRGFVFVDFTNKTDAQKAYDSLKASTHLYGRRLVLEWAAEDENLDDLRLKIAQLSDDSRTIKKRKVMLENLE